MMTEKQNWPAGKQEVLGLQLLFVVLVLVRYLEAGMPPAPALLGVFLLTLVSARVVSERLWVSLVPLAVLGLCYQSLGGLSHQLTPDQINITNLIEWERMLFAGSIPAKVLQDLLSGRFFTPFLDLISNVLYFSHFIIPVVAAVVIWHRRRDWYWVFIFGLLVLSYAGFATYVLFPAAPPWWAHARGYLSEAVGLSHFFLSREAMLSTPNPVAAMPSLHCAYPLYVALFGIRLWGIRAAVLLLLPAVIGLAVVYLGHHYVIDDLVGYAYAMAAYLGTIWFAQRSGLLD